MQSTAYPVTLKLRVTADNIDSDWGMWCAADLTVALVAVEGVEDAPFTVEIPSEPIACWRIQWEAEKEDTTHQGPSARCKFFRHDLAVGMTSIQVLCKLLTALEEIQYATDAESMFDVFQADDLILEYDTEFDHYEGMPDETVSAEETYAKLLALADKENAE